MQSECRNFDVVGYEVVSKARIPNGKNVIRKNIKDGKPDLQATSSELIANPWPLRKHVSTRNCSQESIQYTLTKPHKRLMNHTNLNRQPSRPAVQSVF
jgi:hypothetical protein